MTFRRSNVRWIPSTVAAMAVIAVLVACGDPKYQPPAIVVAFDPNFSPPASLNTGAYAGIAAVVTNDNANAGVKFSCVPDQQPGECGSFTPAQTGSAIPICYLAPGNVPDSSSVTVTATSVSDATKSISATITIVNGPSQPCP